jgi:YVTN family beta-propeller protein
MKLFSSISAAVFVPLILSGCVAPTVSNMNVQEKVYVAIEGENHIAVLNPETQTVIKTIDLLERVGDIIHEFSPHNVQVAPDGKSVWVTANHGHGEHDENEDHQESDIHGGREEHGFRFIPTVHACHPADEQSGSGAIEPCSEDAAPDQLIVINPRTDTITKRIPIDLGVHLAHVVVTKDGSFAYATAQERGMIYKIDARTFKIADEIEAPKGSEPHGLRLSPDSSTAYIALLQGKGLGILDLQTDTLTTVPLAGNAVQTGVTPDGKSVVISLYNTKQLAVFDVETKKVITIDLPEDAKGPIQMYPTPNSRFVYVADQGYYFEQPNGNRLYKIDLESRSIIKEITAGDAPHGIVISPDGKFAYVTNLLSQDISIIDTVTDTEVGRITVGKMPNGISIWSRSSGGTP